MSEVKQLDQDIEHLSQEYESYYQQYKKGDTSKTTYLAKIGYQLNNMRTKLINHYQNISNKKLINCTNKVMTNDQFEILKKRIEDDLNTNIDGKLTNQINMLKLNE